MRNLRALAGATVLATTLGIGAPSGAANDLGTTTVEAEGGVTSGMPADTFPSDIELGDDGLLWWVNFDSVWRRNADGTVSQFNDGITSEALMELTPGPGGMWFTEFQAPGRIGRITPDGTITEVVQMGATGEESTGQPQDIVEGPDGNIWYTIPFRSGDPGAIGRVTPAGVVTEFFPPYADAQPRHITVGPDGNLWFTDPRGGGSTEPSLIVSITTDGDFSVRATAGTTPGFSDGARPGEIVTGGDGNVWFTSPLPGAISRITPAGAVTEFPGTDLVEEAQFGSIVAACDALWVAQGVDNGPQGFLQVTYDGEITRHDTGLPANALPDGLTVGPDGDVWSTGYLAPGRIMRTGTGCDAPEPPTETTAPNSSTTGAVQPAATAAPPATPIRANPTFTG